MVDEISEISDPPLVTTDHPLYYLRLSYAFKFIKAGASIEEWGWTIPVLVDEAGGIIAGHGRVMAAHRLGLEGVPIMVAVGWSDAKKRAYMLADNKLTLNGEWDLDRLAIEIAELRASDFDISLIGFNESEIGDLLKGEDGGLSDPDEAPEPPAAVKTVFGGAAGLAGRSLGAIGSAVAGAIFGPPIILAGAALLGSTSGLNESTG